MNLMIHVGLEVHNDSIAANDSTEVGRWRT